MSDPRLKSLPLEGGPVGFAGAVSLEKTAAGVRPWRLPHERRGLFHPVLQTVAAMTAGVRLTLVSDTTTLEIDAGPRPGPGDRPWTFDLFVDGRFHQRRALPAHGAPLRFDGLHAGEKRLEVYFYPCIPTEVTAVRIDADASAGAFEDDRPRWTVYGSSITHCADAAGPGLAWPALVAARLGLNHTSLGYGGGCHMEPAVARIIRDLPADVIGLKVGINVYSHASLSPRTFREAVLGTVLTIRDKHPTTPIAVASPIYSPTVDGVPNAVGMTLVSMRLLVREAVDALRAHGDAHVHYVDGLDLLGPESEHLIPDGVHPSDEGNALLAERYATRVMPRLGVRAKAAREARA